MTTLNLSNVITNFEEDCETRNMTHESIRRYVSAIRILGYFCDDKQIDIVHIQDDDLLLFLKYLREERKNSPKTVMNVFNSLSTFYEFLVYRRIIQRNPIPPIRKRYVRSYKKDDIRTEKRLLSVEEMAHFISIVMSTRDKAMLILLAKTGIRRNELITLDIDDVNIVEGKITLKPTPKRSNRVVFIDVECSIVLKKWLDIRQKIKTDTPALFTNGVQHRATREDVYSTVLEWARLAGYHDPSSNRCDKHFSPHCFRHWFTTHLLRNGMPREYIKELRGDSRREAIDIYNHIDLDELKKAYLSAIPHLL